MKEFNIALILILAGILLLAGIASAGTSYLHANGQTIAKINETGIYYYHPDHLGSMSVITDENGNVVEEQKNLPFGELIQGSEKYGFTGKEFEPDLGLNYFGARYYSPATGRFLTIDPAMQYPSPYIYGGNNPLKYVDRDGRSADAVSELGPQLTPYAPYVALALYATMYLVKQTEEGKLHTGTEGTAITNSALWGLRNTFLGYIITEWVSEGTPPSQPTDLRLEDESVESTKGPPTTKSFPITEGLERSGASTPTLVWEALRNPEVVESAKPLPMSFQAVDIKQLVREVREELILETCVENSILLVKRLRDEGEEAYLMELKRGGRPHFYVRTKNWGDINPYPGRDSVFQDEGELIGLTLDGVRLPESMYEVGIEWMRDRGLIN